MDLNKNYTIAVRHKDGKVFYRSNRYNAAMNEAREYADRVAEQYAQLEVIATLTRRSEQIWLVPDVDARVAYSGDKDCMLPIREMDIIALPYFIAGPSKTPVESMLMTTLNIDQDDIDKLILIRSHGETCHLDEHTSCIAWLRGCDPT